MTQELITSDNHKTEAARIWDNCSRSIQRQVGDTVWKTTFSTTKAASFNRNSLILQVPTALHKMRIERRHFSLLRHVVNETTPGVSVRIEINQSLIPNDDDTPVAIEPATNTNPINHARTSTTRATHPYNNHHPSPSANSSKASQQNGTNPGNLGNINPRFTFDQFVMGSSNRFAHAAALAVAEHPSNDYNPLFIHGDSGLGKTHLLQAIAHYSMANYPNYKLRYVTSETFLNEFIKAIRNNTQPEFKQQYRHNNLLLVDDIQFLQDKDGLQEEFFHTFNDILQSGGQIVLSSDRSPDAIPKLENRLRSRFRSGLITDIQPPDLVTRLAILHKKVESKTVQVPPDVLHFIAENITNSIRELEGALIKIVAYTNLSGQPCNLPNAKQLLSHLVDKATKVPITIDLIINTTCKMYGLSSDQLTGASRRRPLVEIRQIAMYLTRQLTELSYPEIGRGFGNRDHTTIMHAFRKIENQLIENQDLFNRTQELQTQIIQAQTR